MSARSVRSAEQDVTITVTLTPAEAAGLKRLCDKVGHDDAMQYLYPHIPLGIRNDQAYDIVHGAARVCEALGEAGVSDWPWIESGTVEK
ncbi:MAG TPA: hypothetical protein VFA39_19970 [Steroidobacteraceae bacterium]|nr:hypothetical protein [Steroidobacteraceae bacterium]